MQTDIADYLAYLSTRTTSNDTRRVRRYQLQHFARWCSERGIKDISHVDRVVMEQYVRWGLEERRYALNSMATISRTLKAWFNWLADIGRIARPPRFGTPHVPLRLPHVLEIEEIQTIIDSCNPDTYLGARDRALIEFLYASGVRAIEAHRLDLGQLDLQRCRCTVLGKGGRSRVALFTPRAAEALDQYVTRWRRPQAIPYHQRAVFLSITGMRLPRGGIWQVVRRRAASVKLHVTPHMFRHSVATHLLRRGVGLRDVQTVLGHVRITSTQLYTHLTVDEVHAQLLRAHPRA